MQSCKRFCYQCQSDPIGIGTVEGVYALELDVGLQDVATIP